MAHFSKADLARLSNGTPGEQLYARGLVAAHARQYAEQGYIGDPPGTPAAPAAAAPAAPVAPLAGPAPMTFRERVSAMAETDPLRARMMLLENPARYLSGEPDPAPAPVAAPVAPAPVPK